MGFLLIRRPLEMALIGSGGAQNTLKLNAGDYIGKSGIAVCIQTAGVKGFAAEGKYNRTDIDIEQPVCHVMVYGPGFTGLRTLKTLTAYAAVKTTSSFSLCCFFIH